MWNWCRHLWVSDTAQTWLTSGQLTFLSLLSCFWTCLDCKLFYLTLFLSSLLLSSHFKIFRDMSVLINHTCSDMAFDAEQDWIWEWKTRIQGSRDWRASILWCGGYPLFLKFAMWCNYIAVFGIMNRKLPSKWRRFKDNIVKVSHRAYSICVQAQIDSW